MAHRATPIRKELHRSSYSPYLGIPVNTLYQWRYLGNGPRSYKVGRWVRYDPDEVRKWLSEQAA